MAEQNRLPSQEKVIKWTGRFIFACSVFALVILLVMKFALKESVYLSDMLILAGLGLIGYGISSRWQRLDKQEVVDEQEENKHE